MKTKLAIAALIMLCGSGCMTTTNSYTRDIVYRDGSYYSPADEQYGDYYYEPEPDYSSYYDDDYYYGFNSGYYGRHDSYRCRFSYRHDRYCGSGSSYLNFGGLTLVFGNSHHHGYGYPGYYYSGYGGYPHYNSYPYYGWYTPRPRNNGPIPMPKPTRPFNQTPDYGLNNAPGMRVSGEPTRVSTTKPGRVNENPVEPTIQVEDQQSRNPYTRVRDRRPYTRPEIWRNNREDNTGDNSGIRLPTKPAQMLVRDDDGYTPVEKPVRRDRRPQPYPQGVDATRERQPVTNYSSLESAPQERVQRDNRQQQPAPRVRAERVQRQERVERAERVERSERPARIERQENNDDGNGAN